MQISCNIPLINFQAILCYTSEELIFIILICSYVKNIKYIKNKVIYC